MIEYQNKSGRSGIAAYEFVDDGVIVQFKNGAKYHYPIEGNNIRSLETMHGLLDWGIYANRMINARNPNYTKIEGPDATHDSRPYPEKIGNTITDKFMARAKPIADKFSALKTSAMRNASNFGDWLKTKLNK